MQSKSKNRIIFMLYALCLGAVIGAIVWTFLKLMNTSIEFLWDKLPSMINIPFYTIIICTLGGLIIGLWRRYAGDYPEELEEVIIKVKKDGKYPYNNIGKVSISAILPLIFGGSIGPEAGLTGIIVGLCSWINDKFKDMFKEMKELTQIGISATLGTIFNSPMFGFVEPIETEEDVSIPKVSKIILYFLAIFGALGIVILLNSIFQGGAGMTSFSEIHIGKIEWLWLIPLSLIGVIGGIVYSLYNTVAKKIEKYIKKYTVIKCVIAGLLLGIAGTFLPYTMFSGEEQMLDVMSEWQGIGASALLLTAIVKLFITNTCIILGFKGGHFFPCIFSGVCIGYAVALLIGIDPVFCVCIITTALMAYLLKKPFATVLLLMICFPTSAVLVMLLAAVIGSYIKKSKFIEIE